MLLVELLVSVEMVVSVLVCGVARTEARSPIPEGGGGGGGGGAVMMLSEVAAVVVVRSWGSAVIWLC